MNTKHCCYVRAEQVLAKASANSAKRARTESASDERTFAGLSGGQFLTSVR